MNKIIKNKKKDKLNFKKVFNKEERLFIKQYPRLFPICFKEGISRLEVKRVFKKDENLVGIYKNLPKDSRETFYRAVIAKGLKHLLAGINN